MFGANTEHPRHPLVLHQVVTDYNVADTFAQAFQAPGRAILGRPHLAALAEKLGVMGLSGLADPHLGEPVKTSRSSWVRIVQDGSKTSYIKTYAYPSRSDRLRCAPRFTAPWKRSRAHLEAVAMAFLKEHGFAGPDVVGVVENRRLGWLWGCVLVLREWQGQNLESLLPQLDDTQRLGVADALGRFVTRLHLLGFRDRNLDLRNILARQAADGATWELAKIDSPRHRIVNPGARRDRLSRADWARLAPQLERHSLLAPVRAAAMAAQR